MLLAVLQTEQHVLKTIFHKTCRINHGDCILYFLESLVQAIPMEPS